MAGGQAGGLEVSATVLRQVSDCHAAPLRVEGKAEQSYYVCKFCDKACNAVEKRQAKHPAKKVARDTTRELL